MPERAALFVTTVASTLEAFLLPLADALRADGWRIDALSAGASGLMALEPHFDTRYDATWSRSIANPRNVGMVAPVRKIVAERRYDIVHVHTPIASFVTRYALRGHARDANPQVIYTAHGFHFYKGGGPVRNLAFRSAERLAARWTDFLVTMNTEDYDAARALGTISPERVRFIPGVGVDPAAYQAPPDEGIRVRDELAIPRDALVVTMIAEMNANKRHAFVLDAFASMKRRDSILVLVGDGPFATDLRAHAVALGMPDRVLFVGHRRDIPAILAASNVLTLASGREGLPRVVLEAMSASVPIIATRTRGVVDLVGDCGGWLVDTGDSTALARAFDYAAAHPEEARARGAAGLQRVVECYSQPKIVTSYLGLYDEALAQIHR